MSIPTTVTITRRTRIYIYIYIYIYIGLEVNNGVYFDSIQKNLLQGNPSTKRDLLRNKVDTITFRTGRDNISDVK